MKTEALLGCFGDSRKAAELADEFAKTNGIKLSAGERNGLEAAINKDAERFFRGMLNGFERKSYGIFDITEEQETRARQEILNCLSISRDVRELEAKLEEAKMQHPDLS